MEEELIKYVHFWKKQISDKRLQILLDRRERYPKSVWLILLDEKLRRAEKEIAII